MRNIWRSVAATVLCLAFATQVQATSVTRKLADLTKDMPISVPELAGMDAVQRKQVACLAYNIYFEARGSTMADQIGVAYVVLNRIGHPEFRTNACEVVFQLTSHAGRTFPQFSWTTYRHRLRKVEWDCWELSQQLALLVWQGHLADPTDGATYFRDSHGAAPRVTPRFSVIGGHVFIREMASR